MCNAPRCSQGGPGANKPPRWGAERRASPARRLRKRFARDARRDVSRLRAYVIGPRRVPRKHPGACRRSASLFCERYFGNPRRRPCLARTVTRARSLPVILRCERSEPRRTTAPIMLHAGPCILRGSAYRALRTRVDMLAGVAPQDDGSSVHRLSCFTTSSRATHSCASSTSARPRSR